MSCRYAVSQTVAVFNLSWDKEDPAHEDDMHFRVYATSDYNIHTSGDADKIHVSPIVSLEDGVVTTRTCDSHNKFVSHQVLIDYLNMRIMWPV